MIKNVIFDLDGTLLDTIKEITLALNETLADFHLPSITLAEGTSFLGHGTEYLLTHALKGAVLSAKVYQKFKAAYMKRQITHQLEKTLAFKGITSLLTQLLHRQIRLFVYSNKPHEFAVTLTEAIFPGVFLAIIGQKPGFDPKPNIDSFRSCLKEFKIDPKTSLYVGDSLVDIETGQAMNMRVASVTWGYVPRASLIQARPDFIIDDVEELLKVVADSK